MLYATSNFNIVVCNHYVYIEAISSLQKTLLGAPYVSAVLECNGAVVIRVNQDLFLTMGTPLVVCFWV